VGAGRGEAAAAAVRRAVRGALAGLTGAEPLLVACSGGADSVALAAATVAGLARHAFAPPGEEDDPIYAEHWAGHRPVTVTVEEDQIVIRRAGEDAAAADDA